MAQNRSVLPSVAAILMASTLCEAARAAPNSIFDVSPDAETGWMIFAIEYVAVPGQAKPITNDPAHPYVGNAFARGRQVTERVSDTTNPILTPWSVARMKKANDDVLNGKTSYTAPGTCHPGGVPGIHLFPGEPAYFVETAKEITMIQMRGPEVRRIMLNIPHSKTVRPSWYGDSVGHFEGDTLVVDTIGLADKGPVDNWRTPHSDRLHVIERYRLTDDGKVMEVLITMEDPVAFTAPWTVMQKYRRVHEEPLSESICAENNTNYFNLNVTPIPQAEKPDF